MDWGYFKAGFADDFLSVKAIDENNNTITTAQSTMFGFAAGEDSRRWYAFNLLEETDSPGEYFIDRSSGILYYYPPVKPEAALLELSMLRTHDCIIRSQQYQFSKYYPGEYAGNGGIY